MCGVRDLRSGGFGVYDAVGSGIKGDSLLPGSTEGEMRLKLVPTTAKGPEQNIPAEAIMLWFHIAHYVQCRGSWTHLEDSPETLPGRAPESIPLPATLSSGRLRRAVEARLQPGIMLPSWPLLQNVATFSTRVQAGGGGRAGLKLPLPLSLKPLVSLLLSSSPQ